MLTLADQPDTFYLRIQKPEEMELLHRKDIVVRWRIRTEYGFTWKYISHEFYERQTLVTDWKKADSYRVPMTGGLRALIESSLEWEIWQEFWAGQEPEDGDQTPLTPPQRSLPGIDRRRLFEMLLTWRMSRMAQPRDIPQAVEALRLRLNGNANELGRRTRLSHATIVMVHSGVRSLSGSAMMRMAEVADQLMEWFVAKLLRSHAMVASLNVIRRGGHR